ncbi:four-helix bundle copper-binding protein [Halorubrum gandharaense]
MSAVPASESEVAECIQRCFAVVEQCECCLDDCGAEKSDHDLSTCRDVADLATLCARLLARDSPRAPGVARECLNACKECLEACDHCDAECCQECVSLLEECIESCEACC